MHRNGLRAAAAGFAFAIATTIVTACGEAPTNARVPIVAATATPVGLETPTAGSIYVGAYVPPSIGGVTSLERAIGRTLALDAHYQSWVALFPTLPEDADIANGRISVESWDCGIPDAQVVSGQADMLIATRAQAIKDFGRPVFLRFMWDANLPASTLGRTACLDPAPDGTSGNFSAKEYVAAYQHVHQIFAEQGVTNVVWVWSYSSSGSDPTPYYPGAAYVDWIGVDAYNGGGLTFASLIGPAYPFAAQFGKPIMISETGAVPNAQGAYLSSVMPALQQQFPKIDALMYYDGTTQGTNWALGFAGISAFGTLASNPYLAAFGSI